MRRYRNLFRVASLLLLLLPGGAWADGKPEIKSSDLLIVAQGKTARVVLYGDNLAPKELTVSGKLLGGKLLEAKDTDGMAKQRGGRQVTLELSASADCLPDYYDLTLTNPDGAKVTVQAAVVVPMAAERDVKRPCGTFAQAMPLEGVSCAVSGTLPGDSTDTFRFYAKAGETWEIRLLAGRVGSSLDSMVRLRDATHICHALAAGDEKRDRRLLFRVPIEGVYYLEVTDAEGRGGTGFAYRLTLRKM